MIKIKIFLAILCVFFMTGYIHCSYALTPDQVLQLRKAGVSDKTIQMMLKQEMDAKELSPYDQIGVREIKDREGNVITVYSTGRSTKESSGDSEDENVNKAWRMLQNMIINPKN